MTTHKSDAEVVATRHIEWTFGWEQEPDSPEFSFEDRFAHLYDHRGEQTLYYDDLDQEHRVFHTSADYGAAWQLAFRSLRSARHGVVMEPQVLTSDDLASSFGAFVARIEPTDAPVLLIRTTSSLLWRRIAGQWRITRDLTASRILSPDEFDSLWKGASAVRTQHLYA